MSHVILEDYETSVEGSGPPVTPSQGLYSFPQECTVLLYGAVHPEVRIAIPLPVSIDVEADGTFIVADEVFAVYGEGISEHDALKDYVVSLVDFFDLVMSEAEQNPAADSLAQRLRTYLQRP